MLKKIGRLLIKFVEEIEFIELNASLISESAAEGKYGDEGTADEISASPNISWPFPSPILPPPTPLCHVLQ